MENKMETIGVTTRYVGLRVRPYLLLYYMQRGAGGLRFETERGAERSIAHSLDAKASTSTSTDISGSLLDASFGSVVIWIVLQ